MARKRLTRKQISAWRFFYFPLIIGLVIGTSAASATDQWWWAADFSTNLCSQFVQHGPVKLQTMNQR